MSQQRDTAVASEQREQPQDTRSYEGPGTQQSDGDLQAPRSPPATARDDIRSPDNPLSWTWNWEPTGNRENEPPVIIHEERQPESPLEAAVDSSVSEERLGTFGTSTIEDQAATNSSEEIQITQSASSRRRPQTSVPLEETRDTSIPGLPLWRRLPSTMTTRQQSLFDATEDTPERLADMVRQLSALLPGVVDKPPVRGGLGTGLPVVLYVSVLASGETMDILSSVERLPEANYPHADASLGQLLRDAASTDSWMSQALSQLLYDDSSIDYFIGRSLTPRRMTEPLWRDPLDGFREVGRLNGILNGADTIPHAQFSAHRTLVLDSQELPSTTKLYVIYIYPAPGPSSGVMLPASAPAFSMGSYAPPATPIATTSSMATSGAAAPTSTTIWQHLLHHYPEEIQRIRACERPNYSKGYKQFVLVQQIHHIALGLGFDWSPTGSAATMAQTVIGPLTLEKILYALVEAGCWRGARSLGNMRTVWKGVQDVLAKFRDLETSGRLNEDIVRSFEPLIKLNAGQIDSFTYWSTARLNNEVKRMNSLLPQGASNIRSQIN